MVKLTGSFLYYSPMHCNKWVGGRCGLPLPVQLQISQYNLSEYGKIAISRMCDLISSVLKCVSTVKVD